MDVMTELDKITGRMTKCGADGFLALTIKGEACSLRCYEMSGRDLLGALVVIMEFYKENHKDVYNAWQAMQKENADKVTAVFKDSVVDMGKQKELREAKEAMAKAMEMMEKATRNGN